MQGLHLKQIALGLLVLGLLDLAISQPVDQHATPSDFDFMVGTEEPEYEVVPIHKSVIQKRSINGKFHIKLRAFGEHIKLWLEPHQGILATAETPVYLVDGTGSFIEYSGYMKKVAKHLYHNEKEAATMTITELPNGNFKLDGIIGGKGLAIRPAPDRSYNTNRLWYRTGRFKRFIENTPEYELGNYTYHIVSKLPKVPDHLKTLKAPSLNLERSKRSVPDTIYPEVMVIVDYSLFKTLELDHYNVVKYVLSFWNSVDLKYRNLENPRYRINIAGILIAEKAGSLKFMQHRAPFSPYDLLIFDALHDSAKFVLKMEKKFGKTHSFDAVITMTSSQICKMEQGICKRGTLGLAYASGACSLPQYYLYQGKYISKNGFKSAIVYDAGAYDGVNVAAHELGHLLGAHHDGEDNVACDSKVGRLMAPTVSFTANSSDWSYCAVRDLEEFLNSQFSECLLNKPQPGVKLARFLPGRMMNADAQCRALGKKRAYRVNEEMCVNLRCLNHRETLIIPHPGAADGTTCGDNKICLHRQCIDLSTINF